MELAKEQIDQRNRRESPEIDPHKYSRLIFTKEQRQYNEAKGLSSTNVAGTTGHFIYQKLNLDKDLTPFPKLTHWIIN